MSRELKAYLILLTIPVMWGITFPLMHRIVADYAPSLFVFWRFILAALIMSPLFISTMIKRKFNWGDVRYGLILGALNSGSFILQAMSLKQVVISLVNFPMEMMAMKMKIVSIMTTLLAPSKKR